MGKEKSQGLVIDLSALKSAMSGGKSWDKKSPSGRNQKKKNDGVHSHAPYNFVPFVGNPFYYDDVKREIPRHKLESNYFSGEITYTLTAKTKIFSDNGISESSDASLVHDFYKNQEGRYALRASTMRGCIRSNMQVLGLSSMADDVDDYFLMFREVASGKDHKRYKDILGESRITVGKGISVGVLKNVQAGYLENRNGSYWIHPTVKVKMPQNLGDMNYYILSERTVIDEFVDNNGYRDNSEKNPFAFLLSGTQQGQNLLEHDARKKFQKVVTYNRKGKSFTHYKNDKNPYFVPFAAPVSYELDGTHKVSAIGMPGQYTKEGFVTITGRMQEKKAIYVIPEMDLSTDAIQVPDEDIRAFQIDYNHKKNTLNPDHDSKLRSKEDVEKYREFFNLPHSGEIKPVFYVPMNHLYIGFTPRFRMLNTYSVKGEEDILTEEGIAARGMSRGQKKAGIDYTKAIFGYSKHQKALKSRVFFTDAVAENDVKTCPTQKYILSEPKPTDYLSYLYSEEAYKKEAGLTGETKNREKQEDAVSYNDDDFYLRGMKNYWLHQSIENSVDTSKSAQVYSDIKALPEGTVFYGKVRFSLLMEDELGLLLWSIALNKDSEINIGKAKAYGFGRSKLEIQNLRIFSLKKAYCLDDNLSLSPFDEHQDPEPYIAAYKEKMNAYLRQRGKEISIDDIPSVKYFLAMKDSRLKIPKSDLEYMTLEEYKDRKVDLSMLPMVNDYLKKYGHKK